jgi:hypothetical protein
VARADTSSGGRREPVSRPVQYRATVGLSLPNGRLEAGEVIAAVSVPAESLEWLVDGGYLVPVTGDDDGEVQQ